MRRAWGKRGRGTTEARKAGSLPRSPTGPGGWWGPAQGPSLGEKKGNTSPPRRPAADSGRQPAPPAKGRPEAAGRGRAPGQGRAPALPLQAALRKNLPAARRAGGRREVPGGSGSAPQARPPSRSRAPAHLSPGRLRGGGGGTGARWGGQARPGHSPRRARRRRLNGYRRQGAATWRRERRRFRLHNNSGSRDRSRRRFGSERRSPSPGSGRAERGVAPLLPPRRRGRRRRLRQLSANGASAPIIIPHYRGAAPGTVPAPRAGSLRPRRVRLRWMRGSARPGGEEEAAAAAGAG